LSKSEVCEIPVSEVVVGESQARVRDIEKDIEVLADSIRFHGLLEPIVVQRVEGSGYEVLMGQRRLLAHRRLGIETIVAIVVEEPMDATRAKTLSLTENLVRRDLNTKDVIDACTALYRKYGNARAVAEETGLPYTDVLKHIKYDRLALPLRTLVDRGEVRLEVALKAQDAAGVTEESGQEEALRLAKELSAMTVSQQRHALRTRRQDPSSSVEQVVDTGKRTRQIVVTLSEPDHRTLQAYARSRRITQDQAAAQLVVAGLASADAPPPTEQRDPARPASSTTTNLAQL
jgi:ParB family chromosome partitioning protein